MFKKQVGISNVRKAELSLEEAYRGKAMVLGLVLVSAAIIGVTACAFAGINSSGPTKNRKVITPGDVIAALTKPDHYDPNSDARYDYREAWRAVAYVPKGIDNMHIHRGCPTGWDSEERESVQSWITANERALEYLARGAKKPYYWPDYGDRPPAALILAPPEAVETRALLYALVARIRLHALHTEHEQMLSDMTTLWRFGQHFQGRKPASYQLTSLAVQGNTFQVLRLVLAHETLSPARLLSLQRLFQSSGEAKESLYFDVEMVLWIDAIQLMFTTEGDGRGRISLATIEKLEGWPDAVRFVPRVTAEQKEAFRQLERRETFESVKEFLKLTATAARMTPWELNRTPNGVKSALDNIVSKNAFIAWLSDSVRQLTDIPWRAKTDREGVVTILASLRYRIERGHPPDSLEELVKAAYLDHLPRDYYSKEDSLIYKRTDVDFLLYSRGLDFEDNGGTPSRWGRGLKGGDQVFWPVTEDD